MTKGQSHKHAKIKLQYQTVTVSDSTIFRSPRKKSLKINFTITRQKCVAIGYLKVYVVLVDAARHSSGSGSGICTPHCEIQAFRRYLLIYFLNRKCMQKPQIFTEQSLVGFKSAINQ